MMHHTCGWAACMPAAAMLHPACGTQQLSLAGPASFHNVLRAKPASAQYAASFLHGQS